MTGLAGRSRSKDQVVEFKYLDRNPVPVILGICPTADGRSSQASPAQPLDVDVDLGACLFRAVNADRVPAILLTGIDVEPTDAPIFASGLDKAWEYGNFPKAMMTFDLQHLEPSWKMLSADASESELADVSARYPTVLRYRDGERLWCTRFAAEDPRAGSRYEMEYGYWVPGDPFDALVAVFLFVYSGEVEAAETLVRAATARANG